MEKTTKKAQKAKSKSTSSTSKKRVEKKAEKGPKKISPFDIINMMFTRKEEFNQLSDLTLANNYFMINRVFSIKYPIQGQLFNNLDINKAEVIKCWQKFLTTYENPNRVPYFVYTKGSKRSSEEQSTTINIKKQDILDYAKKYNLSIKDVEDIILFNREGFLNQVEEMKKFQEFIDKSLTFKNKN